MQDIESESYMENIWPMGEPAGEPPVMEFVEVRQVRFTANCQGVSVASEMFGICPIDCVLQLSFIF